MELAIKRLEFLYGGMSMGKQYLIYNMIALHSITINNPVKYYGKENLLKAYKFYINSNLNFYGTK